MMNADTSAAQSNAAPIPTTPASPIPNPVAAPAPPPPASPPTAPTAPLNPLRMESTLGTIMALPQEKQIQLLTLENTIDQSITAGFKAFVEIGLALAEINQKELYLPEFNSFEDYCRIKWGFKHTKAHDLMAAARFVRYLAAFPDLPKPERESPVRPLVAFPPEVAERAWRLAVKKSDGHQITARLVKSAVRELQLTIDRKRSALPRVAPVDRDRQIRDCFGELFRLLVQRADYPSVIEKVETLHGHVECLLKKRPAAAAADA